MFKQSIIRYFSKPEYLMGPSLTPLICSKWIFMSYASYVPNIYLQQVSFDLFIDLDDRDSRVLSRC